MKNFTDYLISLVIMALAPAVFEETFFRGGMQNLLHRWTGKPILAILLTSLLFSFIHFSWFGFLPRVALGVVLGLIFYQTGNLWLAILAHFFNNALVVSLMYYLKLQGKPIDGVMKDTDPLWVGVVATVALYCLFRYLSWFGDKLKTAKRTTEDRAREEQWIA